MRRRQNQNSIYHKFTVLWCQLVFIHCVYGLSGLNIYQLSLSGFNWYTQCGGFSEYVYHKFTVSCGVHYFSHSAVWRLIRVQHMYLNILSWGVNWSLHSVCGLSGFNICISTFIFSLRVSTDLSQLFSSDSSFAFQLLIMNHLV